MDPPVPDDRRRAALDAYRHAVDAGRPVRHSVDVVDAPLLTRKRPLAAILSPSRWPTPRFRRVEHAITDPTATAFKVGFGISAGAWLFRFLVIAVAGLLFLALLAAFAGAIADRL